MFHVQHIDSLDLPELSPYQTLKRSVAHVALQTAAQNEPCATLAL